MEASKATVEKTFSEFKSFVKIFTIRDVDSMALYCEEFVSSPAMGSLKEAMQGCDVKQLQDMAKVVREASKKVGRALTEDELIAAVESWRETGSITKAVQAVVDWVTFSTNGTKQKIKNRFPDEVQSGKMFQYIIEDGKIHLANGIRYVDFVIDMDGNLFLGTGHSFLARGMDVQAAGCLKLNSQGYVRVINNASGHYAPTVMQGKLFPKLLNELGIRTTNAWLELGQYEFTSSGYIDRGKTTYVIKQLK